MIPSTNQYLEDPSVYLYALEGDEDWCLIDETSKFASNTA